MNLSEPGPTRIFDRISVLADPVRCRILLLVEDHELAVTELCSVLQLPQSTVSRHLKILADDGWIGARRDGTSRRYSAAGASNHPAAERLWQLLREETSKSHSARQDRYRLDRILARRRTRSQEFFSAAADEWSQLRRDLFGQRFDLEALLGLLEENWIVGDLGCGTGQTTESLSPFVRQVIAVDDSRAMMRAAKIRLEGRSNVELRAGSLERLPIETDGLDAALLIMVLHHLADPGRVLAEAARALKPAGRLVVLDMLPHEREEYRQQMGHIWLGFEPEQIRHWLLQAGFHRIHIHPLRADPEAKGPALSATTARVAAR